jgi:hypothetical protein
MERVQKTVLDGCTGKAGKASSVSAAKAATWPA